MVRAMVIEVEDGTACQCPEHCGCGNEAYLLQDGVPVCGCCMADCPDVHGPNGLTWRTGYQVRAVAWSGWFELHVDGVGITQCETLADAKPTVRDFLETLGKDDASTANITIWKTPA
jgi:hypothetical protein